MLRDLAGYFSARTTAIREKHSAHTKTSVIGLLHEGLQEEDSPSWVSSYQVSGSISLISTNSKLWSFVTNLRGSRAVGEYSPD